MKLGNHDKVTVRILQFSDSLRQMRIVFASASKHETIYTQSKKSPEAESGFHSNMLALYLYFFFLTASKNTISTAQ